MAVSGCTSQGGIAGDPTAVMLGANIGGLTGAVIGSSGSHYHSYRGSLVGSLVGTIAGAAIASAATAPKKPAEDVYIVETRPYRERGYYDSYDGSRSSGRMPAYGRYRDGERSTDLEIRNIRFIDGNRNHIIESGEEAKIIFEVVNSGRLAAYHVTPVVAEKNGLSICTSPRRSRWSAYLRATASVTRLSSVPAKCVGAKPYSMSLRSTATAG